MDIKAQNALGVPYYANLAHFEVVDMTCVQCLVARITDSATQKRWALVDRSGMLIGHTTCRTAQANSLPI
jgi:hypothetical protein